MVSEPLSFIARMARVRPEERPATRAAFLTLFGFMTGHALLETARDSLFLAAWPAAQLPWVYLAISVVALALGRGDPEWLRRFSRRHELSAWLLFAALGTFVFWLGAVTHAPAVNFLLYIWSGVIVTLVVIRFWTLASATFTLTQAKRLFAVIASGSVLGAIAGSAISRAITTFADPTYLIITAAVVLAITATAPLAMSPSGNTAAPPAATVPGWDLFDALQLIWNRPYLRNVGTLVLLSTVTFTFIDFVFKSTVDRLVPVDQMGQFFSTVYLVLNLLSLVSQLLLVGWLLRRINLNFVQTIAPAVLLVSALGVAAVGGLVAVIVLKVADGSLRHSLHRTGTELLFVPVRFDVRGRVKTVIDTVGQRGGQALGSLLILLILTVSTRESVLAVIAGLFAAAWLAMTLQLRKHYLDTFREALNEEFTETQLAFPVLDAASITSLIAALSDPDDAKVVAAIDIMEAQDRVQQIPAIILYHPEPEVVLHALEVFQRRGREDALPVVERLLNHSDDRIVAAAVRAHAALRPDRQVLGRALEHSSSSVSATAVIGLASSGWMSIDELRTYVEGWRDAEEDVLLAILNAVITLPDPVFAETLRELADARFPGVRIRAVRAMGAVGSPIFIGQLVRSLRERQLREEVRGALLGIGLPALEHLAAALGDRAMAHGIRRHVPLAIATFGSVRAARILLEHLPNETDGMVRFKILRALGKIRTEHPGILLDLNILKKSFRQTLEVSNSLMKWRRALEDGVTRDQSRDTVVGRLLRGLLRDKQEHAVERLFRLLTLIHDDEEFERIYRGMVSDRADSRSGGRELIEHLVPAAELEPLLALLDDLYDPNADSGSTDRKREVSYARALREVATGGIESLSLFAIAHIAELGLGDLEDVVVVRPEFSKHHETVVESSRELLGATGQS